MAAVLEPATAAPVVVQGCALYQGDCLQVLRQLADNSIDAIVTDPPYGLEFMGKDWDAPWKGDVRQPGDANYTDSASRHTQFVRYGMSAGYGGDLAAKMRGFQAWCEGWARECLRVLKPGGHLLAFSGSRTYHRMACAIEDAGFEVRDQVMWVYGSGFPKSLDVSKAIDKAAGAQRERVPGPKSGGMASLNAGNQRHGYRDEAYYEDGNMMLSNEPATEDARRWAGWGTALKPAHEPICVARKPLQGTVAANVLAWGTGALNIDGCRVDAGEGRPLRVLDAKDTANNTYAGRMDGGSLAGGSRAVGETTLGRWPANLIHDGSAEVLALFPAQAGAVSPVKGDEASAASVGAITGERARVPGAFHADAGSAARFFYCAKASRRDRDEGLDDAPDRVLAMSNQAKAAAARGELHAGDSGMNTGKVRKNHHPTVKPTELMRYLCRLVTPAGGLVLDPFMGSGSTGKAARLEGLAFVGIEREPEFFAIARARIAAAAPTAAAPAGQPQLF